MSENIQTEKMFVQRPATQKQLTQISLFKNVKFVNGDRGWRMLQEKCIVFQFLSKQRVPFLQIREYFFIVKSGTLQVFKHFKDNKHLKGLIKLLKKDQYSGYQDYPLFTNESIEVEAYPNTIIYAVKLQIFYPCFRRVIPLTLLQQKAQYLKRLIPFNTIEIQKLFNFSSFVERRRCQSNQYLVKHHQVTNELIIIVQGQCYSIDQETDAKIYFSKHQIIGLDSVLNGGNTFSNTIITTRQCQVLFIPKDRFLKLYEIKYKLNEIPNDLLQQITLQRNNTETLSKVQNAQPKRKPSPKLRSYTTRKQVRSDSNVYSMKKMSNFSKTYNSSFTNNTRVHTDSSMSQMHLKKFLSRKGKLEQKAILQYINSKAPQLAINPFKQYSLFKPLHIKNSNYIRNFKRKLKQSASLFRSIDLVDF